MSALTSLLVRDRVVPVSKIEEALHSQVFLGGDIEIILLEMGVVAEDVLSAYRAALFDLLPATREEVMKASREALRRVPPELARSLGIVPIYFEGRSLVVAGWEPLYEPRLREVEAQLGCEVSVRIVNQARLASALAHHYGFELEPRLRRLSDALRRREPGVVPYVRPPEASMRPIDRASLSDGDGEGDTEHDSVDGLPPVGIPSQPDLEHAVAATVADTVPSVPPAYAVEPQPEPAPGEDRPESSAIGSLADELSASTHGAQVDDPVAAIRNEVEPDDEEALPHGVSPQLAALVRGPISLERAIELLGVAGQRDDVLFVLLRYVQQFFDFVCVFGVAKEGARARMAHGAGVTRDLVEHAFVPGPSAGLLADAMREKRPLLGQFGSAPAEQAAAQVLNREPGRLGLVVPIDLNGRVVLLIYVERVRQGIDVEHAAVVHEVVPAVLTALRRIILDGKLKRASMPPQPEAPRPLTLPPRPAAPVARPSSQPPVPTSVPSRVFVSPIPREEPLVRPAPPAAVAQVNDDPELRLPSGSDLSAVDLDAFESLSTVEPPLHQRQTAREIVEAREQREAASLRDRLAGVPRTAPPPPAYETAAPVQNAAGYRFRGGAGLAQERVSSVELSSSAVVSDARASAEPRASNGAPANAADTTPGQAQQDGLRVPEHEPPVDGRAVRQRLSLVEPAGEVPSVIIDMGESVDTLIDSLLKAPPGVHPREIDELLQVGESVLPVLMQHFPGPLWVDPAAERARNKRRPRGRDLSAVARAVVSFGERAAPYLASVLGAGDPERTYYALIVASEIVHADLIDPVARRVLDRDDALRSLALEVLRSYSSLPQYDVVVRAISDLTERPGKDPRRQRLAVEALGELRDSRTLRALIARLSDRDEQVVLAAHRALVTLTGQDFGSMIRRWETWAEGWGRAHRVEWLIESLLHQDEGVRTLAGEELKLLTQQYFGYHPALPKRDREVAQRKYREWWELEGRLSFGR